LLRFAALAAKNKLSQLLPLAERSEEILPGPPWQGSRQTRFSLRCVPLPLRKIANSCLQRLS
jgi:hypothetical protein